MVDVFAVPPAAFVFAALLVLVVRPRLIHPAGVVGTGLALAYAAFAGGGHEVPGTFLGFEVLFVSVNPFSRLMGLIFAFIGLVAVVYSWSTDAHPTQTAYALSYVGSSLGAVFAGDWLVLVFCWELMAITSTLLVWHHGGAAVRAGFRYAVLHGIGGSLVMAAVIWHYAAVGSFLFADASGIVGGVPQILAAVGIGVNVAFVGLHAWLPDTYPRPHVAASVFLCVYTTKTGVYALYRAFPEGHLWIAYMGGAMAVVGVTFALLQNDMRRLLSYHIQSQVGYMVAGVGIGTGLAIDGAFAHVFNHILYKALLFMTVGAVIYRTGAESLKKVHGLWRAMPITFVAFTVAALSIAGFPGFNGFVSKGIVIAEAHHYEEYEPLWYMLLIGGVGTFMSFIKLGYYVFFYGERTHDVERANVGQSIAMGAVAVPCVLFGLWYDGLFAILPEAEAAAEFHVFTIGHLQEGFALAIGGVLGFALVRGPLSRMGKVPDVDLAYNPVSIGATRGLLRGINGVVGVLDRTSSSTVLGTIATVSSVSGASARGRDGSASASAEDGTTRRPLERALSVVLERRAGIGVGVFLVIAATTVALVVAL